MITTHILRQDRIELKFIDAQNAPILENIVSGKETAVLVGKRHGKPVVFCVKSGQMHIDGYKFFKSKNGTWLTDFVPVEYLEV